MLESLKPIDLVFGCGGILVPAVIIATVAKVRRAARERGISSDATGWPRVNGSVRAWHAELGHLAGPSSGPGAA
ncbi:hypothetical protein GCM10010172_15030 [Paractinoplanes ferrugineus]|uniref:Uncharacterized protein n=1 Tax=Paractinoplanes ferrugineus TaxID=113564 RepID=A0A919MJE4_9ACTN|nr:hypothetical protein Afe05nite_19070 [Actinoplanes ferrugineus]